MACPLYCILSAGTVHCIPVASFTTVQETPTKLTRYPAINTETSDPVPAPVTSKGSRPVTQESSGNTFHSARAESPSLIKTRNLLYTLNNPSLSDLESEPSRQLSETSFNQDDELTQDEEQKYLPKIRALVGNVNGGSMLRSTNTDSEPDEAVSGVGSENHVMADSRGLGPTRRKASGGASGGSKVLFKHLVEKGSAKHGSLSLQDSDTDQSHTKDMPIGATVESAQNPDISAILNDYSTHAVYLPQYSVDLPVNLETDFSQIREFLPKIFPSWKSAISVCQLTGGITNMLLSCSHSATHETLLMRVYGKGTNLIIDRNREFVSHLILNSLKLAPPIHARFANGLIYGFLPGRSLQPDELSHPYLYPLIAQQLGHWHNKINCEFIEDGIHRIRKYTASVKKSLQPTSLRTSHGKPRMFINNIWDLMEDWISIIPINEVLIRNFKENLDPSCSVEVNRETIREVIFDELRWVRNELKNATRSEIVVCHCDLLSGNIIIPDTEEFKTKMQAAPVLPTVDENPIQFIDYEYMIPAPRAFDIANHFAEWQGFDCNRQAIPQPTYDNPVMVNWCKGYLNDADASTEKVNTLIDEIACYSGLPGLYWGIWAMIQSELSIIDFNYAEYSLFRLEEYWLWKQSFTTR